MNYKPPIFEKTTAKLRARTQPCCWLDRSLRLCFLSLLLLTFSGSTAFANSSEVAVITHQSVARDVLDRKEVRAAFTMKKKYWSNGERVQVFVLANEDPSHKTFCRKILKIFPRQLESVWYRLEFSGTGSRPIELDSVEEMLQKIRTVPGAIGYLPSDLIDNTVVQLEIN